MKINRLMQRVMLEPKVLVGRMKGLYSNHCLYCLTAKRLMGEDFKTIIDVGANEGVFIKASRWVFPDAKIIAFEPLLEFVNKLDKMKNVEAYHNGLWNEHKIVRINYNFLNHGTSSFLEPTKKYVEDFGEVTTETPCILQRFDSFDDIKIERPCFVKIDVEGAENKVLEGFGERLKEVDIIQLELKFREHHKGQSSLSEIVLILDKFGFKKFIQLEYNEIACDLIFYRGKDE